MAQWIYKKTSSVTVVREMQIKATIRKHLSAWNGSYRKGRQPVHEAVGKRRAVNPVHGNWRYSHHGKQQELPQNLKMEAGEVAGR